MKENETFIKARDRAYKYLAHSARTYAETYEKLKAEQYPEEIIRAVMELLEHYGYINDKAYAEEYVKTKAEYNRYGSRRIAFELTRKGVNSKIVADAIEQYPFDETETAIDHLRKKTRNKAITDYKEKRKMFEFLLRKGFPPEVANNALKEYTPEDL